MSKRVFARAAALLGAAVMSAGVLAVTAGPAQAASLGPVQITQTSGSVNDTPIFTAGTSAACPTGFGENANLRIGRPGGPYSNLAPVLGGGDYDLAPVTVNPNRSFATALGGAPAAGEWWIVMECYSLTEGRHPDEFRTVINVTGTNWEVPPPAAATTTTLAVAPASPVTQGTEVTFTATVAPAAATGTVEFRRGTASLGTGTVTGGTATFATTALPVGTSQYTAVFTPAAGVPFEGSTSAAVTFRVDLGAGGDSEDIEIIAPVDPGAFSIDVAANTTTLAGGTVGGSATGAVPPATVTDLRGSNAGWTVTGQVEPFSNGTDTIGSENLAWTPTASKVSGSGAVVAGAAADLGEARTLCSAAVGTSAGVFSCDAGLTLTIPDDVPPGEYAATMTLTLI